MKKPLFLFLLIILFFHVLSAQERAEPVKAEIGQIYKINFQSDSPASFELEEVAFYQLHIAQKIQNEDLIIIMTGDRDWVHSSYLFMSFDNKYPDGYSKSDRYCGLQGVNICSIPQSEIQDDTTFYLGIFCQSNCKLEFKINYYQEKIFNVGDSYIFDFNDGEDTGLDFKLMIPATNMTEILVEVLLLNVQDVHFGIQLLGQQGNDVPSLFGNQFEIYDTWGDGKAVKLSRQNGWNPEVESNFTFLIVAGENSEVQVNIEGYKELRRAYLEEKINDILFYGESVTYQMEISDWTLEIIREGKYDLSFDLEPYSGTPDLFINVGFYAKDLSDADWKLSNQDQFDATDKREGIICLTISNDDLLKKMENSTMLYLTVLAETGTSFTLLPYISNYYDRALFFDAIENGYLDNGDLVTYQLEMDNLESNTIIIKLHSIKGTVFLYLKKCTNDLMWEFSCDITMDEILQQLDNEFIPLDGEVNPPSEQEDTWFIRSEQKQSVVKFKYNKTECYDSNFKCQYTIGVYAPKINSTTNIENHYRLIASHKYSRINLKENQNHFSYVLIEDKEYYKFYLPGNDILVEKVQIQVTRLTGELYVMVSRNQMYPNITNNDFFGLWEINTYEFTRSQGDIQGYYYIGIEAIDTSNYNIIAKVYRKQEDGSLKSKSKRLYFGNVEQGLLNKDNIDTFFFYNENGQSLSKIFFYYDAYDVKTNQTVQITQFPQIKLYHKSKEGKISETVVEKEYYSQFVILFDLYTGFENEEIYFLEFSLTQEDIYIQFSLSVNQDDLFQLISDVMYTSNVDSGEIERFEIFLEEPSLVYFELFECFGKMEIKGSQTYQDLENQVYNINQESPKKISDHTIYKFPLEKPGSFFFNLITKQDAGQYVKSKDKKESLFMMIPHVMKPYQEIPHDVFYVYDEGRISYSIQGDELKITVRQIQADYIDFNELPFNKPLVYYYKAHITDNNEYLYFHSKCDLDQSYLSYYDVDSLDVYYNFYEIIIWSDQYDREQNLTFVFNELKVGKTYHVQIAVEVLIQMNDNQTTNFDPFYFLYMPTDIQFGSLPTQQNETTDTGSNNTNQTVINTNQTEVNTEDGELDYDFYETDEEYEQELMEEKTILGIVDHLFYMILGGIISFILVALFIFFKWKRGHPLLQQYQVQEIEIGAQAEEQQVEEEDKYEIE